MNGWDGMNGGHQATATDPGPMMDVWAKIGLHLETQTALMREQQRQRDNLLASIRQVQLTPGQIPLSGGAGTLDQPELLGPKSGYAWAVNWVTAASFTAGTVNLYVGAGVAVDSDLRFVFSSAGVWEPNHRGMILMPGERMYLTATGITGLVTVSGRVTLMSTACLPQYLL